MIYSHQLNSLVQAVKAAGETEIRTQLLDGTIIEIRWVIQPQNKPTAEPPNSNHPIALLTQHTKLHL